LTSAWGNSQENSKESASNECSFARQTLKLIFFKLRFFKTPIQHQKTILVMVGGYRRCNVSGSDSVSISEALKKFKSHFKWLDNIGMECNM